MDASASPVDAPVSAELFSAELVGYAVAEGIATITLDSPGNRNALSRQLVGELVARLEDAALAASKGHVRGIVLTHTGTVFCAGADLSEAASHGVGAGARDLVSILRTILTVSVPVIAVVRGAARAGGLGILGACDVVVASSTATFAFTEVRIGVGPAIISLTTMHRMSSRAVSRYYMTGETFDAAAAESAGLISVFAPDADEALEPILAAIRQGSPQGLAESKKMAAASMLAALDAGADAMVERSAALFATDQAKEGMAAFLERRKPNWHLST